MFSIQKQNSIYTTLKILLPCKFSRNDLISLLILPEASSASVPGEYLMLITFKLKEKPFPQSVKPTRHCKIQKTKKQSL